MAGFSETAGGARQAPVSRGFMAVYTLAQIGAFIAFLPLLQVLLPLRATAIDPLHGPALLSRVALAGAVVASLANIGFGMLSDRTRSVHGRRSPWVAGGLAGTLASYALVREAATPAALLAAILVFQLVFNAMFAALGAVLADHVPDRQRGLMSALLGLGQPVGSIVGLSAVGAWRMQDTTRYEVVAGLVLTCVLPFAWRLRHAAVLAPRPRQADADHRSFAQMRKRDFLLVWTSRLCMMTALAIVQGYLLLFLQARGSSHLPAPLRPEAAIAQMTALATASNICCALLGGALSDRLGYRRSFVAVGALLWAASMACLVLLPGWAGLRLSAVLYGGGTGLYSAVDLALMVSILPSSRRAGAYLGIMNLCNTIAQVAAPLMALQLLGGAVPDYRALFAFGGIAALLGAVCITGVRRV